MKIIKKNIGIIMYLILLFVYCFNDVYQLYDAFIYPSNVFINNSNYVLIMCETISNIATILILLFVNVISFKQTFLGKLLFPQ